MNQDDEAVPGVGARLRQLRQERRLSARQLAERADVTASYLSRLENGHLSPTVSTLTRLVQAMDSSLASLFATSGSGPVVRREDRRLIRNRGVDDYLVTSSQATRLEVLETIVAPHANSGTGYSHPGDEECVLVLRGQLVIFVDGHRHVLDEGDAITFLCRLEHRWENVLETPTRALWIISPPAY